jgi:DNA gyrase subunit A
VQSRGGVGAKGSATRDKDFLEHLFVATNHNWLLIFTEKGKCYWMRIFEIPEGGKNTKGRAILNLINIDQDDSIKAFINVEDIKNPEYTEGKYIIMCTKKGTVKKTKLDAYSRPRTNGINAITVKDGDTLLEAKLTNGSNYIMMAVKSGKAIRFEESKVRPMGRTASGVRGIRLANDKDEVVGMIAVESEDANVLVVSEKGYGKRSHVGDYRITNRGGKGVKTINVTDKTGELIAMKKVTDDDDLMIITKKGITIRMHVDSLRVMGRATQGVKLINLKGADEIAAVAVVYRDDEDEDAQNDEFIAPIESGSEEE